MSRIFKVAMEMRIIQDSPFKPAPLRSKGASIYRASA